VRKLELERELLIVTCIKEASSSAGISIPTLKDILVAGLNGGAVMGISVQPGMFQSTMLMGTWVGVGVNFFCYIVNY
jgi:predicted ATP-dependent serine protease